MTTLGWGVPETRDNPHEVHMRCIIYRGLYESISGTPIDRNDQVVTTTASTESDWASARLRA